MTQDEMIELARQAGLAHFYDSEGHCTGITDADLVTAEKEKNDARLVEMLMPFAKLVEAKKQAECEKAIQQSRAHQLVWYPDGYSINPNKLDSFYEFQWKRSMDAIRARGEA